MIAKIDNLTTTSGTTSAVAAVAAFSSYEDLCADHMVRMAPGGYGSSG